MSASSSATAPGAAAMSPALVVFLLALLFGIQPVTTDLYLPALPALTAGFGAPMAQAQLTLTAMLLAFGISQLVWGQLSDRFGRRPILLAGTALYAIAGIGCALAPTIASLIVWRAAQGAAMGAAVMGARAIVRDLYEPPNGARVMSMAFTGLGVIACASGPIGGLLAAAVGWRWVMAATGVFGGVLFAIMALRFQESLPPAKRTALHPLDMARAWWAIVRHPTFRAGALLSSATYAGLFTFLAASSFVYIQVLGLTRWQYGLLISAASLVYVLGTFLCRRLLPRVGLRTTVAIAGGLSLAGGTSMGLLALAGAHSAWASFAPFLLYMLAHGIHQPCGQSSAVAPFPGAAGTASALTGFVMMVVAFGVGGWVGQRLDGTVFALTNGVWFWSVCLAAISWTLMQRDGEVRRT
ncbi:MAG: multidrug effflux MFS transporter [Pseudomonadota bacterium]